MKFTVMIDNNYGTTVDADNDCDAIRKAYPLSALGPIQYVEGGIERQWKFETEGEHTATVRFAE